jgi:hypothetical protein
MTRRRSPLPPCRRPAPRPFRLSGQLIRRAWLACLSALLAAGATPVALAGATPLAVADATPLALAGATPLAVAGATPLACLSALLAPAATPVAVAGATPLAVADATPVALARAGAVVGRGAGAASGSTRLLSAPSDPADRPGYGWRFPLAGHPQVTRPFDLPDTRYGPGHRGVDLAGVPGAAVLAAGPGVVGWAGVLAGRGVVSVRHAGGLRTTYEPLTPAVRAGQPVRGGDVLGLLAAGHPGCPGPACLHWGLLRGDSYLDPLSLLEHGPVRLLPLAGSVAAAAGSGTTVAEPEPAEGAPADPRPGRRAAVSRATTAMTLGLTVAWAVILTRRRPP